MPLPKNDFNAAGKPTPDDLIAAARVCTIDTVKDLLRRGVDIDAKDRDGNTMLMAAAACARVELVELLADNGASLKPRNNAGRTALDCAVAMGHRKTAQCLREVAETRQRQAEASTVVERERALHAAIAAKQSLLKEKAKNTLKL